MNGNWVTIRVWLVAGVIQWIPMGAAHAQTTPQRLRFAPIRADREPVRVARLPSLPASATSEPDSAVVSSDDRSPTVDESGLPADEGQPEAVPPPIPASVSRMTRQPLPPTACPSPGDQPRVDPRTLDLGKRANRDLDAQNWMERYRDRLAQTADSSLVDGPALPPQIATPWWDRVLREESAAGKTPRVFSIDRLVEDALQYSSYVSVVSADPLIRRTSMVVEQAEFDWRAYLNSTYKNLNEPVGNTLTTGTNENRFKDQTYNVDAGMKRRNMQGGEVKLNQRFGQQENNSRFLVPNPQGTTKVELQYTQPLLNGYGQAVNESRVVLAQIDSELSQDDLVRKLESHLISVTEAYWELYRARAEYFQRSKLLHAAEQTLAVLEGRQEVDAVSRQILRARAAVASRRSEIVRSRTSIRNAESQLRLLVNSPELWEMNSIEFAPGDTPLLQQISLELGDSLQTALVNRADISQAIRDIRASAVRLGVADNQVLPKLDVVIGTYVSGLAPNNDAFSAYGKGYSEGRPSYNAGLLFEFPLGNRAARAKQEQRQLEMARAMSQFRLSIEEALTGVEIAVREEDTSYREMTSHQEAMLAAENEVGYLTNRWNTIPGVDDSLTVLLENLLDAQERLADEEAALARAQVGYAMSVVRVKREMGTLIRMGAQCR